MCWIYKWTGSLLPSASLLPVPPFPSSLPHTYPFPPTPKFLSCELVVFSLISIWMSMLELQLVSVPSLSPPFLFFVFFFCFVFYFFNFLKFLTCSLLLNFILRWETWLLLPLRDGAAAVLVSFLQLPLAKQMLPKLQIFPFLVPQVYPPFHSSPHPHLC